MSVEDRYLRFRIRLYRNLANFGYFAYMQYVDGNDIQKNDSIESSHDMMMISSLVNRIVCDGSVQETW